MNRTREQKRLSRRITFWLAIGLLAVAVGFTAGVLSWEPKETPTPAPAESEEPKTETAALTCLEPESLLERSKLEYTPPDPVLVETESLSEAAIVLAKTVWGEARGCDTEGQAAVVWCVLNRVDSGYWSSSIIGVVTQPSQFHGYHPDHPVDSDILALVWDVLTRWQAEKTCVGSVGRVLPKEYLYFSGDGKVNTFRTEYRGGETWDWSLDSPYVEASEPS